MGKKLNKQNKNKELKKLTDKKSESEESVKSNEKTDKSLKKLEKLLAESESIMVKKKEIDKKIRFKAIGHDANITKAEKALKAETKGKKK